MLAFPQFCKPSPPCPHTSPLPWEHTPPPWLPSTWQNILSNNITTSHLHPLLLAAILRIITFFLLNSSTLLLTHSLTHLFRNILTNSLVSTVMGYWKSVDFLTSPLVVLYRQVQILFGDISSCSSFHPSCSYCWLFLPLASQTYILPDLVENILDLS